MHHIKHVLLHRVKLGEKPSVDYLMNECRFLISLMHIIQSNNDYLIQHELDIDYEKQRSSRSIYKEEIKSIRPGSI